MVDASKHLVCPACHGLLGWARVTITCTSCARTYPITGGVPILVLGDVSEGDEELEHEHKRQQSSYFDRDEATEFEIVRPFRGPALYEWFLREKFRRATAPIRTNLSGHTAISVCGGSGMDAHFLAEAGADVISLDISLGAAKRAGARSRRFGVRLVSVVADVENLPLNDWSIDLVYVHDGLHHLERPERGIAEMARVARRWVSITEPARAAATGLAVRLGLALETEEAGNPVARLEPRDVVRTLAFSGLHAVHVERYAMYYRHRPGRVFELLSRRPLLTLAIRSWRVVNAIIGRFGNKLVVVAIRPPVA